ncbi:MAG: hypothetical protein HQK53_14745, partial [Oligoflexia bacterium]|nr:hypothetical protein [Oligoflexia bacterium]
SIANKIIGRLQTRWIDDTFERIFYDRDESDDVTKNVAKINSCGRFKLVVQINQVLNSSVPMTQVTISKQSQQFELHQSEWINQDSDGIIENTIFYRIEQALAIYRDDNRFFKNDLEKREKAVLSDEDYEDGEDGEDGGDGDKDKNDTAAASTNSETKGNTVDLTLTPLTPLKPAITNIKPNANISNNANKTSVVKKESKAKKQKKGKKEKKGKKVKKKKQSKKSQQLKKIKKIKKIKTTKEIVGNDE